MMPKNNPKEPVFTHPLRKIDPAKKVAAIKAQRPEYQPEYSKLGVEPIKPMQAAQAAKIAQEDFKYAFDRKKKNKTLGIVVPPSPPDPKKSKWSGAFPNQLMISSGFNHEHTWYPPTFDEEPSEVALPVEDDNVSFEELEAETTKAVAEKISYDEVEDLDLSEYQENLNPNKEDAPVPDFTLDMIKNQEYCIIFQGEILYVADSLEKIEKMVAQILFDDEHEVGINDILVFKKLAIRAGVVIKE